MTVIFAGLGVAAIALVVIVAVILGVVWIVMERRDRHG